jgi:hypothetical protein
VLLCAGSLIAWGGPVRAAADVPTDSARVRFECGAATDLTNELYYEDAFIDTTFLGRRLRSTPEARYAAVLAATLEGTRAHRTASYQLQQELSLGDRLQRNTASLAFRMQPSPGWQLQLGPRLEYRHDRTFDRDLEEWRGGVTARLRRSLAGGATLVELGSGADFLRTSGRGSNFFLDRNSGRIAVALDHMALLGDEWRIGYGITGRVFPDSSGRDHLEHGWEGRWRHVFLGGHTLALETDGERRQTLEIVPVSRDNFWNERGALEAAASLSEAWTLRGRVEGEATQYDLEDSTLFFDYQVVRARVGPAFERAGRWSLAAGPRAEALFSRLNLGEGYRELGGVVEFEYLDGGALWSVAPAAGWRDYDSSGGQLKIHSSYAFYELNLLGDQALPGGLRVRALSTLRLESHTDHAQDARSLYFSCDVRRLF